MAAARDLAEEALAIYQGIGHLPGQSQSLSQLALIAADAGDLEGARTFAQDSLTFAEQIGGPERIARAQELLDHLTSLAGDESNSG